MAWYWCPAKPRLAALCHSSVRQTNAILVNRTAVCLECSSIIVCLSSYTCMLLCDLSYYSPEPHILLFRRPLGTDPQSGRVDPDLAAHARDEYKNQFGLVRGK